MLEIVKGDILDAGTWGICHQVNCQNVMGAGLAKALYTKWPEVKKEYHIFCSTAEFQEWLLGKYLFVPLSNDRQVVINIFGQLNYGRQSGVVYTDYNALRSAFTDMDFTCAGHSLAFPYGFGCGLAGGDWVKVFALIKECFRHCDVKIYLKQS